MQNRGTDSTDVFFITTKPYHASRCSITSTKYAQLHPKRGDYEVLKTEELTGEAAANLRFADFKLKSDGFPQVLITQSEGRTTLTYYKYRNEPPPLPPSPENHDAARRRNSAALDFLSIMSGGIGYPGAFMNLHFFFLEVKRKLYPNEVFKHFLFPLITTFLTLRGARPLAVGKPLATLHRGSSGSIRHKPTRHDITMLSYPHGVPQSSTQLELFSSVNALSQVPRIHVAQHIRGVDLTARAGQLPIEISLLFECLMALKPNQHTASLRFG